MNFPFRRRMHFRNGIGSSRSSHGSDFVAPVLQQEDAMQDLDVFVNSSVLLELLLTQSHEGDTSGQLYFVPQKTWSRDPTAPLKAKLRTLRMIQISARSDQGLKRYGSIHFCNILVTVKIVSLILRDRANPRAFLL